MNIDQIRSRPVWWLSGTIEDSQKLKVSLTDSIQSAASKLGGEDRVLAVVDSSGIVKGALAQQDIAKWISQQTGPVDLTQKTVQDILNSKVSEFVPITEDDLVGTLIDNVISNKFDEVVVMDKNKKFRGIVDRVKLAGIIESNLE